MKTNNERLNLERLWSFIKIIRGEQIISQDDFVEFRWDDERFDNLGYIGELICGLQSKGVVEISKLGVVDGECYNYYFEDGFQGNHFGLIIDPQKFDDLYKTTEREIAELKEKDDQKSVHKIDYKLGKILLNNKLIANPNFNSENELVFDYLYKNPNKRITKNELEVNCLGKDQHFKKSLRSIIQGLGFKGEIKEMFFTVSEKGIIFRNPICKKDLEELNTTNLNLDAESKT